MKSLILAVLSLIVSYLLGSIPTALIVIKRTHNVDIRKVGDGNMGARNATKNYGWKVGILIASIDILKGFLSVAIARSLGLAIGWQMAAGVAAILGHDFPIFANFAGGQGLAATAGCLIALFPVPALIGLITDGIIYYAFRKSSLAASLGFAVSVTFLAITSNWTGAVYFVCLLLFIPLKQFLDRNRRIKIKNHLEPS